MGIPAQQQDVPSATAQTPSPPWFDSEAQVARPTVGTDVSPLLGQLPAEKFDPFR